MRSPSDKIINFVLFGFRKKLHCHLSHDKKYVSEQRKEQSNKQEIFRFLR